MESFFHSLKTELVMHCDYKSRDQARASLFDYMEVFYNRQRRHSTINYVAPLAFEESTNAWSDCPPFVGNIRSSHSGGTGQCRSPATSGRAFTRRNGPPCRGPNRWTHQ